MASICSVPDCGRGPVKRDELCQTHVSHMERWGEIRPIRAYDTSGRVEIPCAIRGCKHSRYSKNTIICKAHIHIARSYNLDHHDFVAMYLLGCGLCGKTTGPLAVDHDHSCCPERKRSCGVCVRGMLCSDCNFLMGWIDKLSRLMPNLLSRIAAYQRAHSRTETTRV